MKTCEHCGKTFSPKRMWARFCSSSCREKKRHLKPSRRTWIAKTRERRNSRLREANRRHPERVKNNVLKYLFGISLATYKAMELAQGGVCAICQKPPHKTRYLCVDHDHKTNKVRGLLCTACNIGVGVLENDDLFHAARQYLIACKFNLPISKRSA